ncbi:hypothetical protein F5Y19DRAFT_447398 [Xylariaceae sp. FL1651]|nr:hypothetical protein F5Y19DRAFT_447398 [Xylariaceae sp. FL1651]
MTALDRDFFTEEVLTPEFKKEFIDRLWPQNPDPQLHQEVNVDTYFELVQRERSPVWQRNSHAITVYSDIVFIIDVVRNNPLSTFLEIAGLVKQKPTLNVDISKISLSLELSVRLWLMSNIRNRMTSSQLLLQTSIPWVDNVTLGTTITNYVTKQLVIGHDRFSEYLNSQDMKHISGLRILWTDDLSSHLTLVNSTLFLFHNTSALKRMKATPDFPLSKDYIDETLATIDLFLPVTKASCNTWLAREVLLNKVDPDIIYRSPPDPRKSRYGYWQARLVNIDETFDRARPRSLTQWVYDTRDMERWWGFWLIAIGIFLTVLFGLIQSITGILQVALPK